MSITLDDVVKLVSVTVEVVVTVEGLFRKESVSIATQMENTESNLQRRSRQRCTLLSTQLQLYC